MCVTLAYRVYLVSNILAGILLNFKDKGIQDLSNKKDALAFLR